MKRVIVCSISALIGMGMTACGDKKQAPPAPPACAPPAPAEPDAEVKVPGKKQICEDSRRPPRVGQYQKLKDKWRPKPANVATSSLFTTCDGNSGMAAKYQMVSVLTSDSGANAQSGFFADTCTTLTNTGDNSIHVAIGKEFWLWVDPRTPNGSNAHRWLEFGGTESGTDCPSDMLFPDTITSCSQAPEGVTCFEGCMAVVEPVAGNLTLAKLTAVAKYLADPAHGCTLNNPEQLGKHPTRETVSLFQAHGAKALDAAAAEATSEARWLQFDWGIWDLIDLDSTAQEGAFAGRTAWSVGTLLAYDGYSAQEVPFDAEIVLLNTQDHYEKGQQKAKDVKADCTPRIVATEGRNVKPVCLHDSGGVDEPSCTAPTLSVEPSDWDYVNKAIVTVYY